MNEIPIFNVGNGSIGGYTLLWKKSNINDTFSFKKQTVNISSAKYPVLSVTVNTFIKVVYTNIIINDPTIPYIQLLDMGGEVKYYAGVRAGTNRLDFIDGDVTPDEHAKGPGFLYVYPIYIYGIR